MTDMADDPVATDDTESDRGPDVATTDDLSGAIGALLPALDAFNRFEGPDLAAPRSVWLAEIEESLPQSGAGRDAALRALRDIVIRRGLRTGHPGFTGWVTTAPTTVAAAAHLAQAVASPQRWWVHPGNHIDTMAARWCLELLGFPEPFVANFTAGGSTANIVGIGAARQHAGEKLGIDAAADGVAAMPEPRVYASSEVHHVLGRALGVLGLGRTNAVEVPLGPDHRIDVAALERMVDRDLAAGRTAVAIVGNAGDVNTGIVDDLPALSRVAVERSIWFHVDGAYGGWGLLDERVREHFGDPGLYDSFAVDPHKWMAAPLGTGLAIVRDGELLTRAFTVEPGNYDPERVEAAPDEGDPASPWSSRGTGTADWGLDFSSPARGIAVWALLKEMGANGMRARVARHRDLARMVADRAIESDELELLAEPELSIACFRYRPAGWDDAARDDPARVDALNEDILARLRAEGRSLPSSTRVDGRYAIRACFINPRTGREDAERLVDDVVGIGRDLVTQGA